MIFSTFSDTLILGIVTPFFSSATSLYTPPKTGSDFDVISLSPTPKASICAPSSITSLMIYSSKELLTVIWQSCKPASSSILRACFVRYVISPLSILMPILAGFISLNTLIAFGTPDLRTLYVSTSRTQFSG